MIGCLQSCQALAMFFGFGSACLRLNQLLFALPDFLPQPVVVAFRLLQSSAEVIQLGKALFGSGKRSLELGVSCLQAVHSNLALVKFFLERIVLSFRFNLCLTRLLSRDRR